MPEIISVSKVDLPNKIDQAELKDFAHKVFSEKYEEIDRLLESYDNARIKFRNLCVPVDFFYDQRSFREKNEMYIKYSLKYSVDAIEDCLNKSNTAKEEITDIIFISTTGISTPSIDALIINELKLNPNINRTACLGSGMCGRSCRDCKSKHHCKSQS